MIRMWLAIAQCGEDEAFRYWVIGIYASAEHAQAACRRDFETTMQEGAAARAAGQWWDDYSFREAVWDDARWAALPLYSIVGDMPLPVEGGREAFTLDTQPREKLLERFPCYTVAAYDVEPTTAEEAE